MQYPAGVVKLSAIEGLLRKPVANKYELIVLALQDTATVVYVQSGCWVYPMLLGEYLVEYVVPVSKKLPPLPPGKAAEYDFTTEEVDELGRLYDRLLEKKVDYFTQEI